MPYRKNGVGLLATGKNFLKTMVRLAAEEMSYRRERPDRDADVGGSDCAIHSLSDWRRAGGASGTFEKSSRVVHFTTSAWVTCRTGSASAIDPKMKATVALMGKRRSLEQSRAATIHTPAVQGTRGFTFAFEAFGKRLVLTLRNHGGETQDDALNP